MPILQSKKTTYEFTLEDIQKLIANDLKVNPEAINVNYNINEIGGDHMCGGIDTVTDINVTLDELTSNESTLEVASCRGDLDPYLFAIATYMASKEYNNIAPLLKNKLPISYDTIIRSIFSAGYNAKK